MSNTPLLHTSPGSQHCRRVVLLIHEAGMDVDTKIVDVRPPGMGGENETREFLALNPNGKVPVLTHGDLTVFESNAIMLYLCELFEATELLPADRKQRAEVLSWQFWQSSHLSPTADALMVENMMKPMFGAAPDDGRIKELHDEFHRWAGILDDRLESRDYLVGDSLTCADLSAVAALMYRHAAALPLDGHQHLTAWVDRLTARRSWIDTEPPPMPGV